MSEKAPQNKVEQSETAFSEQLRVVANHWWGQDLDTPGERQENKVNESLNNEKSSQKIEVERKLRSTLLKNNKQLYYSLNRGSKFDNDQGHYIGIGSTGDYVILIQKALNLIYKDQQGYEPLKEEKDFGSKTKAVVSRFQKDFGLKGGSNGVVGPETIEKLDAVVFKLENVDFYQSFFNRKKGEDFNDIDLNTLSMNDWPNYMTKNETNIFTYNTISNWFGWHSQDVGSDPNKLLESSEAEKQEFMAKGTKETLLILMGEFISGTGPRVRRFYDDNFMTKELMRSLTVVRGYSMLRENIKNNKINNLETKKYLIPYSPDNAGGLKNSLSYHFSSFKLDNLAEFSRGSVTMKVTKFNDRAVIEVIDDYSISSANFIARAKNMLSSESQNVKNQTRARGKYSPMGTTTQEYIWSVNLKDIILDYEKIKNK